MAVIEVEQLTKKYPGTTAIKDLSFEVHQGEVVGFLGANGAGKTTTMRILSGFMPPSSGTARVAGYDVFLNSKEARSRVGYMPENVPLYSEMRVEEYLRYRAALKGIPARRMSERLQDVEELCNLQQVMRKRIGVLSKGYRQRVGLADALIHEPSLLILDEPTIGLDPNQIRQVRELIRNLGRRHTILLSTHILSEVEMTCSRVIILHRGKIEASGTPSQLREKFQEQDMVRMEFLAKDPTARSKVEELDEVLSVEWSKTLDEWIRADIRVEPQKDIRESLYQLARTENWKLRELAASGATLEDVFVELTHNDV
ncbi:MAG: ABC transporter ATP-binding protein [Verrucomicrobiales bacterium]